MKTLKNTWTPWGKADFSKKIASGITEYITPSHGGIKLSKFRLKEFSRTFPNTDTWAGLPWFEEDADIQMVMVFWPQFFDKEKVDIAKEIILKNKNYNRYNEVREWLKSE